MCVCGGGGGVRNTLGGGGRFEKECFVYTLVKVLLIVNDS